MVSLLNSPSSSSSDSRGNIRVRVVHQNLRSWWMVVMRVPIELLWKFISFLPVFFLLLILAIIKAALFGPIAAIIIFVGNSAVIIGLWPAHFIWTYYCVLKTKRLGLSLKILVLVTLPLPLVLWPVLGVVGSLIVGIGYGILTPLIITFKATGEQLKDKVYHYFVDGSWSTIKGSCTIVVDVIDLCFHSYFSFMDELSDKIPEGEKPINIKLLRLPGCFVVSLLAVPVDVLLITSVALCKSPSMLFKGWKRLLEDLIGREGPFLESVCVPFAGLAIILWPLAVICGVFAAFFCSFFLGLYAGVVVHQENSFKMGLAFIVSVVSLFDEYTNDMLYLREGSCLPRPKYRRDMIAGPSIHERRKAFDSDSDIDQKKERVFPQSTKVVSERSSTLKWAIQQLRPMQVWDWLFRSCEVNGRILIQDGLISIKDIEECIVKGNCNKLGIKLPAWCIMQCLLQSAKANSTGLLISDDMELTKVNWPKDKVFEWFIAPLLIIKEQIKGLHLDANEEACLRNLIMTCSNERPDDWDNTGFPSEDNVKRAQLQAIIRRLQGIVASMTRIPTFRRRFRNLVKVLYVESIKAGVLENRDGGVSSVSKSTGSVSAGDEAESSKSKDIPNFADEIAKITENDSIV